MSSELVRTKGSIRALTSSAMVCVRGREGHARQAENVSKGKGCCDPRSPHTVLDGSKIQVQEILYYLSLSFPISRKEVKDLSYSSR